MALKGCGAWPCRDMLGSRDKCLIGFLLAALAGARDPISLQALVLGPVQTI